MPLGQQKAFYFADIQVNAKNYQEMMNKDCNKLIPEHQNCQLASSLLHVAARIKGYMGLKNGHRRKSKNTI